MRRGARRRTWASGDRRRCGRDLPLEALFGVRSLGSWLAPSAAGSVADEPAGTNCAAGGVALRSGVDDNSDGLLADPEVDRTHYVCNVYVVQSSGGADHGCALTSGGQVRRWGDNTWGQLGNGGSAPSLTPATLSGLSGATAISSGGYHSCALLSDGSVRCWGYNATGQLGEGAASSPRRTPVAVSGLSGAIEISAGRDHTCAVRADGTASCWGDNGLGQLGDGTTTDSPVPVLVSGLSAATVITAGHVHSCAVLADGTARCWGRGNSGELGDGAGADSLTPVAVSGLSGVASIALGYYHSCSLQTDGSALCWGLGSLGQLGDGSSGIGAMSTTPVVVSGLSGAISLVAGFDHNCALLGDGSASCWGSNFNGDLGDGGVVGIASTPLPVGGLSGGMGIAAGWDHSCVLLADANASCWRLNDFGEFGDGTNVSSPAPVPVFLGFAP